MVEIYQRIRELAEVPQLSKHEQIVNGLIASIEDRVVERGQLLPSINQMATELGFARKTIDRAYGELKFRGLVKARNRRGYFVNTEDVEQSIRIALVLYEFRPFQEMFYNVFRANLGDKVQIDTFFHHNNLSVFKDTVTNILGRYGLYIIAPIVSNRVDRILEQLPSNRLLLIDRFVSTRSALSHVTQEFENSTYGILNELRDKVVHYKSIVLFFREKTDYPTGILRAFRRFGREQRITLRVLNQYEPGTVEKDQLYVTIGDSDLWTLLEDCIDQQLVLGKDVGILAHNEAV